MQTLPFNFMGLEPKHSNYKDARFVVLPVPYDLASSYLGGTRNGPAAIIAASHHVEFFDEELETEACKSGIHTLDFVEPNADGPRAMGDDLFKIARRVVRDGKFLFTLGGDHSISLGLVRAVQSKHRKVSVLQIDAHLDLRDSFYESKYMHACVMRRITELGVNVIPVGIRTVAPEEHSYLRTHDRARRVRRGGPLPHGRGSVSSDAHGNAERRPVTARECHEDDAWVDRVMSRLGDTVYISIDIDGFDPAYAPGTGTPEPGGLDWYQVTGLLRLVAAEKKVVGADLVEVIPIPGQVVTEFLAARLAYKLMGYVEGRA